MGGEDMIRDVGVFPRHGKYMVTLADKSFLVDEAATRPVTLEEFLLPGRSAPESPAAKAPKAPKRSAPPAASGMGCCRLLIRTAGAAFSSVQRLNGTRRGRIFAARQACGTVAAHECAFFCFFRCAELGRESAAEERSLRCPPMLDASAGVVLADRGDVGCHLLAGRSLWAGCGPTELYLSRGCATASSPFTTACRPRQPVSRMAAPVRGKRPPAANPATAAASAPPAAKHYDRRYCSTGRQRSLPRTVLPTASAPPAASAAPAASTAPAVGTGPVVGTVPALRPQVRCQVFRATLGPSGRAARRVRRFAAAAAAALRLPRTDIEHPVVVARR